MRTWSWGQWPGHGLGSKAKAKNKLKAKTKEIQKLLPQRHITVNWGDFSEILLILNVESYYWNRPTMQKNIR